MPAVLQGRKVGRTANAKDRNRARAASVPAVFQDRKVGRTANANDRNRARAALVPAVFQLRLCKFWAGADSRRLTPPTPLSLTRRYNRRDGRRGENGIMASDRGLTVAGCSLNAFMHNVGFKTAR